MTFGERPARAQAPDQVTGAMRHSVMLEVNEYLVLDMVRAETETTRPEIAARLGLSAASVSRIVRRLVARGLVIERPGISTTGGRPRSTICFNDQAGCVIGIDLGGTQCHGVLADLSGTIIDQDIRPVGAEGAFAALLAGISTMQQRAARRGIPVAALAVGIPAILEPSTGRAVGGPSVGWDGFPVVAELGRVVDVPFVVENDVNLAALAHAWRGDGRRTPEFAVLAIGTGIGAGIVSDGRLLKGHRNAAGEAGYLVPDRQLLRVPPAGGRGGLERVASGPAIVAIAHERLRASGARRSPLRALGSSLTTADVFRAAAKGDRVAGEVVEGVVEHIAMAVVAVAAITDPEVVILEGAVGRALAPWRDDIAALVTTTLPAPPRLAISSLGQDATTLGAVAAALELVAMQGAPQMSFDSIGVHVGQARRSPGYLATSRREALVHVP
jgi:glucokinase